MQHTKRMEFKIAFAKGKCMSVAPRYQTVWIKVSQFARTQVIKRSAVATLPLYHLVTMHPFYGVRPTQTRRSTLLRNYNPQALINRPKNLWRMSSIFSVPCRRIWPYLIYLSRCSFVFARSHASAVTVCELDQSTTLRTSMPMILSPLIICATPFNQ